MKYIAFFSLLFFFLSCSHHIEEKEINHPLEKAQNITIPCIIKGKIDNGMDEDYFRFEVKKADFFYFSVNGLKGFDIALTILNAQGQKIKTVDDFFKNFGESLPNLYLSEGIYYIKIAPGINDHKNNRPVIVSSDFYFLEIGLFPSSTKNMLLEKEPNDDLKNAQIIALGDKVKGYFTPILSYTPKSREILAILKLVQEQIKKDFSDKDLDIYSFSLSQQGDFILQMELTQVLNSDSTIILVDEGFLSFVNLPENQKSSIPLLERGSFFIVDSNGFDKGEGIANFKIKGNRRYYIILTAISRLDYRSIENIIENPYFFTVNAIPLTPDLETEPNNSMENAVLIQNNVMKGFLNPLSDRDYYLLDGSEEIFYKLNIQNNDVNQQVSKIYKQTNITLIPPQNIDLALEIYDEKGKLIKIIDNQGKGGIEKIPNLITDLGGKNYIVVRAGSQNEEDNYIEPYELKVFFTDKEADDTEYEGNDEINQNQGPNTFSDTMKAYINNKGDKDNFYSVFEEYGKYRISLKAIPGATFVMELYDSRGFFMQKVTANQQGANVFLDFMITRREVFRLCVYTLEKNFYDTEKPYFLTIEKIE